jgi:hypothetical protein
MINIGVALNWIIYGSSGYTQRPGGISYYSKCTPTTFKQNEHIKTIVNTQYVDTADWNPHSSTYIEGYSAVNTDGIAVPAHSPRNTPPTHTGWHINHYALKSREEFEQKMSRGSGDGSSKNINIFQLYRL